MFASIGANHTPDPFLACNHLLTVTANLTINAPLFAHSYVGAGMRFILKQDTTGGRVIGFAVGYKMPVWTPNTGPSKVNTIDFTFDGTNWLCVGAVVAA